MLMGNLRYESAVAFRKDRLGRWMHVSTIFDPISKMVTHYVNGRSFSRKNCHFCPIAFRIELTLRFSKNSWLNIKEVCREN